MSKSTCVTTFLALFAGVFSPGNLLAQNQVAGDLIQFNDNGAWSWFSEERAIVDRTTGTLMIGSVTESNGAGGRDADAEIALFSIANGSRQRVVLNSALGPGQGGNDHNSPVLTKLNDGRYVAAYATHGLDDLSRFRTSSNPNDPTQWDAEVTVSNRPNNVPNSGSTTYSNIFQLSNDSVGGVQQQDRIYNFHRSRGFDPNFSYSDDGGASWTYGGRLLNDTPSDAVTRNNVRPYVSYASNGTDEIHFINTENLPGTTPTGIYHGVVRNGKIFDSFGNEVDGNIYDTNAVAPDQGTQVFSGSSGSNGRGAWNSDIELDASGNPYIAFSTQVNNNPNDLRYHYARFDGTSWQQQEIAFGGTSLIQGQPNYSGNISLDPNDPNTVYISTNVDPTTGTALTSSRDGQQHYEIYRGVRGASGTFGWTAVTQDSGFDNLRPIVPDWDTENRAVVWMRGSYGLPGSATNTGQGYLDYDLAVVGTIESDNQVRGQIQYVDANLANTQLANGTPFNPTSDGNRGATDGNWHLRTGFGSGDDVFTAVEQGQEEVDVLETIFTNDGSEGLFDVFAYFWANGDEQWELQAGLEADRLNWVRQQGAEQIDLSEIANASDLLAQDPDFAGLSLLQFFVGRTQLDQDETLSVFIDQGFGSGLTNRTWYDGIGVARVSSVPEPSSVVILMTVALAGVARRRRVS